MFPFCRNLFCILGKHIPCEAKEGNMVVLKHYLLPQPQFHKDTRESGLFFVLFFNLNKTRIVVLCKLNISLCKKWFLTYRQIKHIQYSL